MSLRLLYLVFLQLLNLLVLLGRSSASKDVELLVLRHTTAMFWQVSGVASAASLGRLCDCGWPGIRGHRPAGGQGAGVA